jgi:hypothetical protein
MAAGDTLVALGATLKSILLVKVCDPVDLRAV